ncbi:MAG: C10 family peptidase [Deltaproteobacteria bacterium]|nr:C10 family peptidase [Deltaproteobacteria bacterium]
MRKNRIVFLIFLFGLLCPGSLWARPVSDLEAEKAARHWARLEQTKTNQRLPQTPFSFDSILPLIYQDEQIGYLVKLQPGGFILIPALTELSPIAFISYEGDFEQVKNHPFLKIIQDRLLLNRERLGYCGGTIPVAGQPLILKSESAQAEKNEAAWNLLLAESSLASDTPGSGEMVPLLTSKWNQWDPYNIYVPDPATIPTGCVATAMAQLMFYWKHPVSGQGSHGYSSVYGYLSADFNHPYDWANMLEGYSGGETTPQRQAVARLLSDVGIAINTQYAPPPTGSSAGVNANDALSVFFKYSSTAARVNRAAYPSSGEWFNVFKDQLDNRLPVLLAVNGISVNGTFANHAVVVDGYRTDNQINLLHANLGWGGLADTYYAIDQIYGEAASILDYAVTNIYPETFVPETSISGTITGFDGLPIEHVEVQVWKETAPATFQKVNATQTNPGGFYSMVMSPGRYKVYLYSEIANFYLWQKGSPRRFLSEWFDNHGSMNWDMMIDEAEVFSISRGNQKVINGVLEQQCSLSGMGNPSWMAALPYGGGDYSIQWGGVASADRYLAQRATQPDYSDAVSIHHAQIPPYPFERNLPMGSYYYRVRMENHCGASIWTTTSLEVPYWSQNWNLYLPLIIN